MEKTIQVGARFLTFRQSADRESLIIKVSGHDAHGMYGSESITLTGIKCLDAFVALCETMPGAVQ